MSCKNKTAKLKLSQFCAADEPKWLTDYNNDMSAIDAYIGKIARTATVVVGLELSGYTADQVDVLIKSTDNAATKITEAINKLPSIGGEIKFLEGEYFFANGLTINKNNIIFNGCGKSTIFKLIKSNEILIKIYGQNIDFYNIFLEGNANGQIIYCFNDCTSNFFNCLLKNTSSFGSGIFLTSNSVININSCEFNVTGTESYPINIIGDNAKIYVNASNIYVSGKTNSNWRNIWIDGMAELKAWNQSQLLTMGTEFNTNIDVAIGDQISFEIFQGNSGELAHMFSLEKTNENYIFSVNEYDLATTALFLIKRNENGKLIFLKSNYSTLTLNASLEKITLRRFLK